ncbi:MAG: hypothetical protein LBR19_08405 [Bifidobacteriaceae bacterium]|jgi:hypothetical protein|nr:hypothetical protein [Bifidobacteriaceae bacterium]
MACFLATTVAAVAVGAVKSAQRPSADAAQAPGTTPAPATSRHKVPWRRRLTWLFNLFAGGSVLLALEHIWHGEVIFAPPFLTAMSSAEETAAMWREIGTVGVGMVLIILAAWGLMVFLAERVEVFQRLALRTK